MAWWLKILSAFAEGQCSVPSTHMGESFSPSITPFAGDPICFFWIRRAPEHTQCIQAHTRTRVNIKYNKL